MGPVVLVYKHLENWVILFGHMLGFTYEHHGAYMGNGLIEAKSGKHRDLYDDFSLAQ